MGHIMNKLKFLSVGLLCWACGDSPKDDTPWTNLFSGTDLEGWTQKGGEADYEVRDGMVVGTTVHGTPNSFMTTDKMYGGFILALEYKVDSTMNSGLQVRSNSVPQYEKGRVQG